MSPVSAEQGSRDERPGTWQLEQRVPCHHRPDPCTLGAPRSPGPTARRRSRRAAPGEVGLDAGQPARSPAVTLGGAPRRGWWRGHHSPGRGPRGRRGAGCGPRGLRDRGPRGPPARRESSTGRSTRRTGGRSDSRAVTRAIASASPGSLLPARRVRIRSRFERCGGTSPDGRARPDETGAAARPRSEDCPRPRPAARGAVPEPSQPGTRVARRSFGNSAPRWRRRAHRRRRRRASPCGCRSRSLSWSASSCRVDTMDAGQAGSSASSESHAPMRPWPARSVRATGALERKARPSRTGEPHDEPPVAPERTFHRRLLNPDAHHVRGGHCQEAVRRRVFRA